SSERCIATEDGFNLVHYALELLFFKPVHAARNRECRPKADSVSNTAVTHSEPPQKNNPAVMFKLSMLRSKYVPNIRLHLFNVLEQFVGGKNAWQRVEFAHEVVLAGVVVRIIDVHGQPAAQPCVRSRHVVTADEIVNIGDHSEAARV